MKAKTDFFFFLEHLNTHIFRSHIWVEIYFEMRFILSGWEVAFSEAFTRFNSPVSLQEGFCVILKS